MTDIPAPRLRKNTIPIPVVPQELWREKISIDEHSGCWHWTGRIRKDGTGDLKYQRRHYMAHRLVYANLIGPITPGYELRSACRNLRCVNPKHREAVTPQTKTARSQAITAKAAAARLQGYCVNGHNLHETGMHAHRDSAKSKHNGTCAQCNRDRVKEYKQRNLETTRKKNADYQRRRRRQLKTGAAHV